MDDHLSAPLNLLQCGVPQGSIGGPLLWLCFTCDQPDVIHDHAVDAQDLHRGCGQVALRQAGRDVQDGEADAPQLVGLLEEIREADGDCGDMVGYVDDGAYSYAHKDPAVLSRVLTRKYSMFEDWMNGNKLVVNQDKTHLMVMGTKKMTRSRN